MFIDRSYPAYDIAVAGLPLFASGFIFFAVNIVSIGYFQSVERARPAMMITVLRGFVFYGTLFIWLAVAIEGARDMAGGSFGGNTYFFSDNGNLLS